MTKSAQSVTNHRPAASGGPGLQDLLRSLPTLRQNPLKFLQEVSDRYGELVHLHAGPFNAFVLSRPEDIQRMLVDNHTNYSKDTIQYNSLAQITGHGLLTSDGDAWLQRRRRMQPAFHRQHIQSFGPVITTATQRMLERWQAACGGGEVIDVDREMMRLALEILGKSMFATDLYVEAPALTSAVLIALDHVVQQLKSPTLLPRWVPTPKQRRFKMALHELDQAVEKIAQTYLSPERPPTAPSSALLSALLDPVDGRPPLTSEQVRDELVTILIAGHETVASALTWSCALLAQNPGVETRLRREVLEALGDRPPQIQDLERLDYTRRVFDEALRLFPPAWLITRKSLKEDVLSGVRIPPNSLMIVAISAAHRNPNYWIDGERFDPDRFTSERSTGRARFAYLPFGGGPHLCIGNHFALVEGPLILASLYQRYHLELATRQEIIADPLVTIRPRGGLPMRVRKAGDSDFFQDLRSEEGS